MIRTQNVPRVCCFSDGRSSLAQVLWQAAPRWRHQMETFYASLALCERNPPVTGGFPSQRPVTRSFFCFLWSAPEQSVAQTIETLAIWDAIVLIMTSVLCNGPALLSSQSNRDNVVNPHPLLGIKMLRIAKRDLTGIVIPIHCPLYLWKT